MFENALRMHLNHDLVMVDDPQPLPLIRHFRKKAPWLGRCHGDLSNPNQELRSYLAGFIVHAKSAAKSIDRRQRRECRGDR